MDRIIKHRLVDWIKSEDSNSEKVKWIPIFTLEFSDDYKRIFGLTSEGQWMDQILMGDNKRINVIRSKEEYLGIITVLEKERSTVEKLLLDGLMKNVAGNYSLDIFPFLDLIKFAIDKDGGYWAKHAISWLRQDEFDDELCEITKRLIAEKKLDQKSRHYLFKLMKRFERTRRGNDNNNC